MPPVASKEAAESCYRRALQLASEGKNREYALALLSQSVLQEPTSVIYAEAMLKNLCQSLNNRPSAWKKRLHLTRHRSLAKAVQNRQWTEALKLGVDLLNTNPWDVATLCLIAQACEGLHYNEVELVYLKQALDAEPKNPEVSRHCAASLARMGQFDQAIACWHRVEKLVGKDGEATRMISLLAEEKLKYPDGRPPTSSPVIASGAARNDRAETQEPTPPVVTTFLSTPSLSPEDGGGSQGVPLPSLNDENFSSAALPPTDGSWRIPWLEGLLAIAAGALVLQLYPTAASAIWQYVDVRQWSRTGWMSLNAVVVLVLFFVRFRPELRAWRHERRAAQKRAGNSRQ